MITDISSLGFAVTNNVYIDVVNKKTNVVSQHVEKHNKATRQMVTGILRFLCGHFTDTTKNDNHQYDSASKYIPCYAGFGDSNIVLQDGVPAPSSEPRIPQQVDDNWTEYVPYMSKKLEREFFTNHSKDEFGNDYITPSDSRLEIRDVKTTIEETPAGDMDSIYFYIEADTNYLNKYYNNHAVYISELGLFSGSIPGKDDMLAYVRLHNYIDPDTQQPKTNVLYVKPEDTVVIRWVVTIAAIGKDSVLRSTMINEQGDIITNDVIAVPQLVEAHIENIPDGPEPEPEPEDTTPTVTVNRVGRWYKDDDPVQLVDSTFTGTLSRMHWSSSPAAVWFTLINIDDQPTYPQYDLKRADYKLEIIITYPGISVSDNGFPMLADGSEILCLCKMNGTVQAKPYGGSFVTVDLDAGYFGNSTVHEGEIYPLLVSVPTDATTLTLVTFYKDTHEIIRQDTYNLELSYAAT
jgi:hypothetical protein